MTAEDSVRRLAAHYDRKSRMEALAIMDPKADAAGSLARFTHYAAGGAQASEPRKPVEVQVIINGDQTVVAVESDDPVQVVLNGEVVGATESDAVSAAYQQGITAAVQALRWLGKARQEYCHLKHDESGEVVSVKEFWEDSETTRAIHGEHRGAEGLARILSGENDGAGWLPSWRWDDWTEYAEKLHLPVLPIDID